MAGINKSGGQRSNTNSASGQKNRSPTSNPSQGSRVEPSKVNEKRSDDAKKTATKKAAAKKTSKTK